MTIEHNKLRKILNKYKITKHFPFEKDKADDESIFPLLLRYLIVRKVRFW